MIRILRFNPVYITSHRFGVILLTWNPYVCIVIGCKSVSITFPFNQTTRFPPDVYGPCKKTVCEDIFIAMELMQVECSKQETRRICTTTETYMEYIR